VTALPDWMDLPDGMSAEDYEALPEETCPPLRYPRTWTCSCGTSRY